MSDLRRYGARSFSSAADGVDRRWRAAKAARSVLLFVLSVSFVAFVADTVGTIGIQRMTPKLRIVAMGDSTTAGTPGWKSPIEAPPGGAGDETSQYAYWLMKAHPEWEVLNRGVNGERSDQILARFDRDVIAEKPAAVVIIAGVNDVYQGRPAEVVTANLREDVRPRVTGAVSASWRERSCRTTPPHPTRTRGCTRSTTGSVSRR